MTIREAADSDLPAILRAYDESGIGGDSAFTVDEAREQFALLRLYPSYRVFVAEADGLFAGTYALIVLDNLNKRGARAAIVEDVAVLPGFQGRGVGRAMMEHARQQCRAATATRWRSRAISSARTRTASTTRSASSATGTASSSGRSY